jgi:hypothetical protein
MTSAALDERRAARVIEARLARPPQDMLEAAVVLEAWGGLPAQAALDAGRGVMRALPYEPEVSTGRLPPAAPRQGSLAAACAFVVATLAIAGWAGPLSSALGAAAVERALTVALPLTLALQWGLHSAFLGRRGGLVLLGRRPFDLAAATVLVVAVPALLLGIGGLVAGLLTLTWVSGAILIRRGWGLAYAVYIVLGTVEMHAGLPALAVLDCIAGAAVVAAAMALRGPWVAGISAGRAGRAAAAAAIGTGLGLMLVVDSSLGWSVSSGAALALLPSVVGGLWAGHHLLGLGDVIARAVGGVPVSDPDGRGPVPGPLHLLAGALWRLAAATAGLSIALLALTPWLGPPGEAAGALAAFGLLAVAMLVVSVLESLGRAGVAVGALACAVALEAVAPQAFPGAPLLAGAALAVAATAPAAIALLRRPGRTLATRLWIA